MCSSLSVDWDCVWMLFKTGIFLSGQKYITQLLLRRTLCQEVVEQSTTCSFKDDGE
ncbi:hypothetical protein BH10BAC2_BH10BAC2_50240 [soil metagenome]